jgi:membrane associated rhomboid family serine protease
MNFLNNLPQVTKNLLLLNITVFIVVLILAQQGTDYTGLLGAHYINSPLFEPFQMITYMFMHSLNDFLHIVFNMLLLVMFGAHLERIWGPKRFFLFYFACGIGAFALYNAIGVWEIMELKSQITSLGYDVSTMDNILINNFPLDATNALEQEMASKGGADVVNKYFRMIQTPMVGASGALFGILAGFAVLFPNTQLMLLFPPIPIKAKYLIGAYLIFEVYNSFYTNDQIAHLAHVGGAIVGIILVLYWRKTDRSNFY